MTTHEPKPTENTDDFNTCIDDCDRLFDEGKIDEVDWRTCKAKC